MEGQQRGRERERGAEREKRERASRELVSSRTVQEHLAVAQNPFLDLFVCLFCSHTQQHNNTEQKHNKENNNKQTHREQTRKHTVVDFHGCEKPFDCAELLL